MPKQINESILIDQVTPEIIGIFWLTAKPLDRALPEFDQLNYLFDGLISQFLYGENVVEKRANIFFTDNFSKTLFLAHLNTQSASKSEIAGDIDEQIALIQSNLQGRNKILVLQDKNSHWMIELQKRYNQFNFIDLLSDS